MGNGAKSLVLLNIFQPLEHSINFQVFGLITEILQTFRTCLPFALRPEETGGMLPTPVLAGGSVFCAPFLTLLDVQSLSPSLLQGIFSHNYGSWHVANLWGQAGDLGQS